MTKITLTLGKRVNVPNRGNGVIDRFSMATVRVQLDDGGSAEVSRKVLRPEEAR